MWDYRGSYVEHRIPKLVVVAIAGPYSLHYIAEDCSEGLEDVEAREEIKFYGSHPHQC